MVQELRIEYMPLSGIRGATRNPKDHDVGGIDSSIGRFGFNAPPIIDERTENLVAGHGRIKSLIARKAEGKSAPERIKEEDGEWFVPVLRGIAFRSEEDAEAYLLADNRWTELGGWNEAELADILSDLAEANALEGVGWDAEDVDSLLQEVSFEDAQGPGEFKEYGEDLETQHECPKCGYQWS